MRTPNKKAGETEVRFKLRCLRSSFSGLQYNSDVTVVPCCMNSTISTPFLYQKTAAIHFLARVYLNFLGLFGQCVCIHSFDCSLVSTFTNKTQVSSSVICMMWLRNSLPSLWYHSKNDKAEAILCASHTCDHFRNSSCTKFVMIAYSNCANLIENSESDLWKFTQKFWNCQALSVTNFLVNTLNKIITHYRWPTNHFNLLHENLVTYLWTFYTIILQFLHSLNFS
jgi:hypothetical protein